MRLSAVLALAASIALSAGRAHAGMLVTPFLDTGAGNRVVCRVLNAGRSEAKDVVIEIVNNSNGVQTTNTLPVLFPGFSLSTIDVTPSIINFCRVSGKGISKGNSRLTLCVADAAGTPIVCLSSP